MKRLMAIGAALAMFAGAQSAQATTYDVSARFFDGGIQAQTLFSGSFSWDGNSVSNFTGDLTTSMWAWDTTANNFKNKKGGFMDAQYLDLAYNCPGDVCTGYAQGDPAKLHLTYQLASSVSGDYVTVTTFRVNSTDVVAGGGYDVWGTNATTDPNNAYAYGNPDQAARNNNAFFTLVFNKNNPTDTSLTFNQIVYADETRFGMMGPMVTGWLGMTAHQNYGAGVGSMGGYPTNLTITAAVPEPETYAMMMAGLGMVGFMSRRRRRV
jgi:hypothetical protein